MKNQADSRLSELEKYRQRLVAQVTSEAEKYGFTFEDVVNAHKLSFSEKQKRYREWSDYYAHAAKAWEILRKKGEKITTQNLEKYIPMPRPLFPAAEDYKIYLELKRVERVIEDLAFQVSSAADKAFSKDVQRAFF